MIYRIDIQEFWETWSRLFHGDPNPNYTANTRFHIWKDIKHISIDGMDAKFPAPDAVDSWHTRMNMVEQLMGEMLEDMPDPKELILGKKVKL